MFILSGLITLISLAHVYCISENFVTQLCPGSVGPSFGEVLRFDPLSKQATWAVPSKDLDCWVTLRGRPTAANSPQRKVTLTWRSNPFSFRGADYGTGSANSANNTGSSGCTTAYLEIYNATNDGRHITPPVYGPSCGVVSPPEFTTTSQAIVLHFYVLAPTSAQETVGAAPNASAPNATAAPFQGPFINFTADFTSYFEGSCSADGIQNDKDQLQCYNQRCIHRSLRCDVYFSNNCGDNGDVRASPPGNCTFTATTTPEPDKPVEEELLPLWIVLGVLAGLLLLMWCCWRPGYGLWRLWRLRNVFCAPCRHVCCSCCSCKNGCCGPRDGCFKGRCCTSCCTGTEKDAAVLAAGGGGTVSQGCMPCRSRNKEPKIEKEDDFGGPGGPWIKFANGDGAHVRELR